MCLSEDCGSSHDAQPGTYRDMNGALFPCHGKTYHVLCNPGSLPGVAEAPLFPLMGGG